MMKKRFSDEQIVAILREGQSGQKPLEPLCRVAWPVIVSLP